MSLWISRPVVVVPPEIGRGRDARFDFYVSNSAVAHRQELPHFAGIADHIDSSHPEGETLGAAALRLTLLDAPEGAWPATVHDCRCDPAIGSPAASYKLLAKAGLTRAVPLSLQGQYGTEAIQALVFRLLENGGGSPLTALSAISWPVQRDEDTAMHCAPAGAAFLISSHRPNGGGFRLLGAAVARHPTDRMAATLRALEDARVQARIGHRELDWAVVHNGRAGLAEAVAVGQPELGIRFRERGLDADYGCADLMVSLNELGSTLPVGMPGILIGAGRFGMVGAFIVVPDR